MPLWVALCPLVVGVGLLALAMWDDEAEAGETRALASVKGRGRTSYTEHIRRIARREERARLARDLHDAVKQQLFVVRIVTRSLKAYLEAFPDLHVVGIADSGEALLERLTEWRPQVVIQDVLIPGDIDGIETTRLALSRDPSLRIVALTASIDEARMMGVLRVGAVGYVRKDAEPEVLLAAVRAVAAGRMYIDPAIGRQVARTETLDQLTPRESEVLRHLALGESNRSIATSLGVTEETVKTHVANVLAKLEVGNRAQVAVQVLKRGLISVEDLAKEHV